MFFKLLVSKIELESIFPFKNVCIFRILRKFLISILHEFAVGLKPITDSIALEKISPRNVADEQNNVDAYVEALTDVKLKLENLQEKSKTWDGLLHRLDTVVDHLSIADQKLGSLTATQDFYLSVDNRLNNIEHLLHKFVSGSLTAGQQQFDDEFTMRPTIKRDIANGKSQSGHFDWQPGYNRVNESPAVRSELIRNHQGNGAKQRAKDKSADMEVARQEWREGSAEQTELIEVYLTKVNRH